MASDRENLIRENFEYERDFNYWGFRELHWSLTEVIEACPDECLREKMLRGFWNQDSEERYPEYRSAVAGLNMSELLTVREAWVEKLNYLGLTQYEKALTEASHRPANDNKRSIDR
jgi:hypothetical protein